MSGTSGTSGATTTGGATATTGTTSGKTTSTEPTGTDTTNGGTTTSGGTSQVSTGEKTTKTDGPSKSISSGAIAGIVVGCAALLAIVAAVIFKKMKAKQREVDMFADLGDDPGMTSDYAAM